MGGAHRKKEESKTKSDDGGLFKVFCVSIAVALILLCVAFTVSVVRSTTAPIVPTVPYQYPTTTTVPTTTAPPTTTVRPTESRNPSSTTRRPPRTTTNEDD